ncbi:1-phosphofructokinase family hexose kinase [Trinickia sp. LjRoot230]|uniref:1-phosphofructokinase family hexose kinase n=1 Tax=Trinickia sp. LjRoot230 TaxID=3342288 RepID=UPI003ECCFDD0
MAQIVTITLNPAVDISFSVAQLLHTRKLRCAQARKDPGGGGINVARVLQRLGSECVAIYLAGGNTGLELGRLLDAENVGGERIAIQGETRENVTVHETSTHREFRFVMEGPEVSGAEWTRCLERLGEFDSVPRYLIASGSLPPGVPSRFYAELAHWARAHDVRMGLDASGEALAEALEVGVFLVKPSLRELCELAGAELTEEAQWREAAQRLTRECRAHCVALTLGERGAMMATQERIIRLPAVPVPVVSAVGAGDSFLAALVWALEHDADWAHALRYAIAAGSAAVMNPGTMLCNPADVIHLYRQSFDIPLTTDGR